MKLGKVIRELDVEPDAELFPTPEKTASEPSDVPDTMPAQPAKVPA